MRLGLCCTFEDRDIKFRTTMVRLVERRPPEDRARYLAEIALHNVRALERAVGYCARHGVGAFRVLSQLFPLATHPTAGYRFDELPGADEIVRTMRRVGARARAADIRLSFHPDQFVAPGSAHEHVVLSGLRELEHQAEVAQALGAEQLTIHGGGAVPNKREALARLVRGVERLSDRARRLVALENDDVVYTVEDLLPVCRALDAPLIYDVHHHRCNPDSLSIDEATELAAATWGEREPWAHISSPRGGYRSSERRSHADYIRMRDVPSLWLERRMTVDVEAKAKEQAVERLARVVGRHRASRRSNVAIDGAHHDLAL